MQVSDKLIKPLTEAKYLNADNVADTAVSCVSFSSIMRN